MKDDACITNMESDVMGKDQPKFRKSFIEDKINDCMQECTDLPFYGSNVCYQKIDETIMSFRICFCF